FSEFTFGMTTGQVFTYFKTESALYLLTPSGNGMHKLDLETNTWVYNIPIPGSYPSYDYGTILNGKPTVVNGDVTSSIVFDEEAGTWSVEAMETSSNTFSITNSNKFCSDGSYFYFRGSRNPGNTSGIWQYDPIKKRIYRLPLTTTFIDIFMDGSDLYALNWISTSSYSITKWDPVCATPVINHWNFDEEQYWYSPVTLSVSPEYFPSTNAADFYQEWNVDGVITQGAPSEPLESRYHAPLDEVPVSLNLSNGQCNYDFNINITFDHRAFSPLSSLPMWAPDRTQGVAFAFDDFAVMGLGTGDNNALYADLWRMDYTTGSFTQLSDFPGLARKNCQYFAHNGKGYVVGGDGSGGATDEVWEYSPDTDSWQQKTAIPGGGRSSGAVFVIGGDAYVGLGQNTSFYKYNIATNTWSNSTTFTGTNRVASISFSHGNTGYVGLGFGTSTLNNLYKFESGSWSLVSSALLPLGRSSASAVVRGDEVFIGLGANGSTIYSTFYVYDLLTGTLKNGPSIDIASVFEARKGASMINHNGDLYVAFGARGSINSLQSAESTGYNSIHDTYGRQVFQFAAGNCNLSCQWTSFLSEIPVGQQQTCAYGPPVSPSHLKSVITADYTMEVAAGDNSPDLIFTTPGEQNVRLVHEYESCVDTFNLQLYSTCNLNGEFLGGFPFELRNGALTFSHNGYGYVAMGWGTVSNQNLEDFWRYDPSTGTWTMVTTFPGPDRSQATVFTIDDKIYIYGGINDDPWDESSSTRKDLWEYNTTTNIWTQKADHPSTGKGGCFAWSYNGKGYVGGGKFGTLTYSKEFYEYNPATNVWTALPQYAGSTGIHKAKAMLINDKAYLVGGLTGPSGQSNDDVVPTMYLFNHSTNAWELVGADMAGLDDVYGIQVFGYNGLWNAVGLYDNHFYVAHIQTMFRYNIAHKRWSHLGNFSNYTECTWFDDCDNVVGGFQLGNTLYVVSEGWVDNSLDVELMSFYKFDLSDPDCEAELPPMANVVVDVPVLCDGGTTELHAAVVSDEFSYQWNLGGVPITGATGPELTVAAPGTYSLSVTSGGATMSSDPIVVETAGAPISLYEESLEMEVCLDDTLNLEVFIPEPGLTVEWQLNDALFSEQSQLTTLISGNYTAQATNSAGCTSVQEVAVQFVNCNCVGDINGDSLVGSGDILIFLTDIGCMSDCAADLDGNGMVNTIDLIILLSFFGEPC
ncbi:MAG: hypothetical protein JNM00_13815, partial [Flavobacteriales bacterium]|nr:hypothetical protein [Flavobacteriales bacterium]